MCLFHATLSLCLYESLITLSRPKMPYMVKSLQLVWEKGSDHSLSPSRRKVIIWINTGISLIRTLGTNLLKSQAISNQENAFENVVCEMAANLCQFVLIAFIFYMISVSNHVLYHDWRRLVWLAFEMKHHLVVCLYWFIRTWMRNTNTEIACDKVYFQPRGHEKPSSGSSIYWFDIICVITRAGI